MNNNLNLEKCFEIALEKVLFVKPANTEVSVGLSYIENEKTVAALDFSGDYSGKISMALKEYQINDICGLILKKFAFELPIKADLVFSEILNMYSGALITELQKMGINISIDPPDNISEEISESYDTRFVKMITDDNLMFKFYFYLRK